MVDALRSKFVVLRPLLDERARRLWAAAEARTIGHGGISRVVEATGMSRSAGLKELDSGTVGEDETSRGRLRRPGGGRKRATELERQLEPTTRGEPAALDLQQRLADQFTAEGHPVSERTVNRLLHALGYSLQGNRKTLEGRQHPDRSSGALTAGSVHSRGWVNLSCRWIRRRSWPQWWPGVAPQGNA